MCSVAKLCLTLCDPMDCSLPGSSVLGDSPGKNTGVGCHALLQGIFPTQGLNSALPYCRWILYWLSHQGLLLTKVHTSLTVTKFLPNILFLFHIILNLVTVSSLPFCDSFSDFLFLDDLESFENY